MTTARLPPRSHMRRGLVSYRHSPLPAAGALHRAEHSVGLSISGNKLVQHSGILGRILCMETLDRHDGSGLELIRLIAVADHSARRPGLKGPSVHLAGRGILHIE